MHRAAFSPLPPPLTNSASAVINPAGNANSTGLTGTYFNNTAASVFTYSPPLFTGTPALTRIDPVLAFPWYGGSPGTLAPDSWLYVGSPVTGTGGGVTFSEPDSLVGVARRFDRVKVSW